MSKLDKHGLNYVLDTIRDYLDRFALKVKTVFSVNGITPDSDGNVDVDQVKLADNLTSDKTQESDGEFIIRTSGGDASIEDGDAFVLRIMGNRVHNGYIAEELNMTVIPIPRPVPASITATLDDATFEAYVETAGTYILTYNNGWSETPASYGVTVSGTPFDGDSIEIVWDGENSPVMTVTAPRSAPDAITATIDRDTFVGYVGASGTYTFTYTTEWSDDLEDYGITVVGDPVGGDQVVVVYVKEDRGTIVNANPSALTSTGWNLYNHALGYAKVAKYSDTYGFRVGGTYTSLAFSETLSGEQETITPVDGMFSVPSDGYVHLLGGNSTDTYIINAWSDWTEGYAGEYEVYSETSVDLSEVMGYYFPYGLLRVANVRDEINLNTLTAISRIGRMAYSAENLASAEASGRPYEVDTDYIYIVKEIEDVNTVIIDGSYVVSDHGNEFFDSVVPVYMETLYGNNLKNKLERDVLTKSQDLVNNLTTNDATKALSAAQGKALSERIGGIAVATSYGDLASLDAIKTKLLETASSMNSKESRLISFGYSSAGSQYFGQWDTFEGYLFVNIKQTNIFKFSCIVTGYQGNEPVVIQYNGSSVSSGEWYIDKLALNEQIENIGAYVALGNRQGTGDIPLNKSVSNFRFVYIQVGYYASGYPQFGQALIPVSRITITSDNTYAIRIVTFDSTVGSSRILFTSATTCNVISIQANTWYTAIFGIK